MVHGLPRENILQLWPGARVPSDQDLTAYWRKRLAGALIYPGNRPPQVGALRRRCCVLS